MIDNIKYLKITCQILTKVNRKMAKALRENPMPMLNSAIPYGKYLEILGKEYQDPNGEEFIKYFLEEVLKEEKINVE